MIIVQTHSPTFFMGDHNYLFIELVREIVNLLDALTKLPCKYLVTKRVWEIASLLVALTTLVALSSHQINKS